MRQGWPLPTAWGKRRGESEREWGCILLWRGLRVLQNGHYRRNGPGRFVRFAVNAACEDVAADGERNYLCVARIAVIGFGVGAKKMSRRRVSNRNRGGMSV